MRTRVDAHLRFADQAVRRRTAVIAVIAAAVTLVTAGCTGVPLSSAPQVVGPVGGLQSSAPPSVTPAPGADQRAIVKGFLAANASDDDRHTAARAFLTPGARNRWSDTSATVVTSEVIGNFDPGDATVTVRARPIGRISATGQYTPELKGDGNGGDAVPFVFGMTRVAGEWRIDTLKNGLVLSAEQFQASYQQHEIYFFDLAESRLVPDPRYSALLEPNQLATWLVTQLVGGPRAELQSAVVTELPAQIDPRSVTITTGTLTTVEMPGASQLDPPTRNHLAASLAYTLEAVTGVSPITITDGGHPVGIPSVDGTQFTDTDFTSAAGEPATAAPPLYYVRPTGAVVDEDGRPLPGGLGTGAYGLSSVALASPGTADLWVAGTSGAPKNARLLVGTQSHGLHATAIQGPLSRPTWAPHLDEVWVGDGPSIYRVSSLGGPSQVPVTTIGGAKFAGQVSALRFSPEGSRVVLVLSAPDGTAQVWMGAVVRTSNQVRVDSLEPISPLGIVATDVAWNDELKLFLIGHSATTQEANVFEVQVDGSLWTPRSVAGLPQAPDSITVAQNVPAWVSAGGTVFTQRGSSWANPGSEATAGTNPVYLE